MPRLTPSDLRRMPASQVIDLLEERLGDRIPMELQLKISILLGAGDEGIHVFDPSLGGESPHTEKLDFENLAKLVNSGLTSEKTPGAIPPSHQETS
ncbi:MAG: hypothetical protein O7H41_13920 [Planctomycetota bacterium]|nr:hypothetical protein [Planctomycetota bacterium]